MTENKPKLTVIDGETLMDTRLVPTKFGIGTLLPQMNNNPRRRT